MSATTDGSLPTVTFLRRDDDKGGSVVVHYAPGTLTDHDLKEIEKEVHRLRPTSRA